MFWTSTQPGVHLQLHKYRLARRPYYYVQQYTPFWTDNWSATYNVLTAAVGVGQSWKEVPPPPFDIISLSILLITD